MIPAYRGQPDVARRAFLLSSGQLVGEVEGRQKALADHPLIDDAFLASRRLLTL